MAWITGRVQIYEDHKPKDIQVGISFVVKKGGKYYCTKTGSELYKYDMNDKLKELIKEK